MSLRWKIALALGALAAVATLAVGAASYRTTRDRLYAEIDRSLAEATRSATVDRHGRIQVARGPLARYEVQVVNADGSLFDSTMTVELRHALDVTSALGNRAVTYETVAVDGKDYRVQTVGLVNGVLQVARPLEETDRVLDSLRTRTAAVVVLVTGAAVLVGLLVAGGVTASLRRLTAAAATVGATGRLDVAVPADGRDEAGRLGVAFQQMLAALAKSRDEQQRLVQDAGHELRTPLTSLRTNIDVLRRHPGLSDDQRSQIVDDLHVETEELVELVNEVIAAATGLADDEPAEELSLGELARQVAERYERRTGRPVVVDADDSYVRAQPAAVQRAVSNLLDNARKFDLTGGPIDVRVRDGGLDVLDRGPGIAEAELDLVFERFHRAAEARSLPGSGLGLSIVREVVERNGGTVRAVNRTDGGAAVGFSLPPAGGSSPHG